MDFYIVLYLIGKLKVSERPKEQKNIVKIEECSDEEDDDDEDDEEDEDDDSDSEEEGVAGRACITEVVQGAKAGTDQEVPNIVLR